MANEYEKDIPWWSGKSIWKIWFDMDCDGMQEYVSYRKSKIDQVLTYYWIPYIHKNDYKQYLKYRIKSIHYPIVNEYLYHVRKQEWYDVSDWDYGKLQDQYNIEVPEKEQTWMDLHVNYDEFLRKEQKHLQSLEKKQNTQENDVIMWMQNMMLQMMKEMKELKNQVWNKNVLLPSQEKNDWWNNQNWSTWSTTESSTNSWEENTIQKTGETWQTLSEDLPIWWTTNWEWDQWLWGTSEREQWAELNWDISDMSDLWLKVRPIDTTWIWEEWSEWWVEWWSETDWTTNWESSESWELDMIENAQKQIW